MTIIEQTNDISRFRGPLAPRRIPVILDRFLGCSRLAIGNDVSRTHLLLQLLDALWITHTQRGRAGDQCRKIPVIDQSWNLKQTLVNVDAYIQ